MADVYGSALVHPVEPRLCAIPRMMKPYALEVANGRRYPSLGKGAVYVHCSPPDEPSMPKTDAPLATTMMLSLVIEIAEAEVPSPRYKDHVAAAVNCGPRTGHMPLTPES